MRLSPKHLLPSIMPSVSKMITTAYQLSQYGTEISDKSALTSLPLADFAVKLNEILSKFKV